MPGSCIRRLLRVLAGSLGDEAVVRFDQYIEPVGVRQQVADALVGVAGQVFEVGADLAAQAAHLLREDDAEFGDEAAQAVVEGGAFFDESLPRAMRVRMIADVLPSPARNACWAG